MDSFYLKINVLSSLKPPILVRGRMNQSLVRRGTQDWGGGGGVFARKTVKSALVVGEN